MTKRNQKANQGRAMGLIVLLLVGLTLLIALLLRGTDVALFNPKGYVAGEQLKLMLFSAGLMLAVAVPTIILFYFLAWKYRDNNPKATYDPSIRPGKIFVFGLWLIPSVMVLALAIIMWPATHKLEPHQPIVANTKPLTIQVIALRWKWLFVYPEQNIASVNFVQVPINTPVRFELTADEAPMSSFWVPHWSGQLYAMTGHTNRLNIIADTPGDYPGQSAEINGPGFAGMKFTARASSSQDFTKWVQTVRQSTTTLEAREYQRLLAPSQNNPATFYTTPEANLYDKVLMKYSGSNDHHGGH